MKNKKEPIEAEIVENDGSCHCKNKQNCRTGKLFWGLFFIAIGVIALADNFGYANVNWDNLWRFWPLLIIIAGLSMISVNNVLWRVMTFFLAIITILVVAYVLLAGYPIQTNDLNLFSKISMSLFNFLH